MKFEGTWGGALKFEHNVAVHELPSLTKNPGYIPEHIYPSTDISDLLPSNAGKSPNNIRRF